MGEGREGGEGADRKREVGREAKGMDSSVAEVSQAIPAGNEDCGRTERSSSVPTFALPL
jgi:hypothetical protein